MKGIDRLGRFVESPKSQQFIVGLIVLNAATLGLETSATVTEKFGTALHVVDRLIVAIFAFEVVSKMAYRRLSFFRDGWNWFDFSVVGIALVPATGPLSVLRTLRVLRVLRLLSVAPQMRRIVEALLAAVPGMSSIAALILMIFYVGAVLATKLFGADFPQWFGHIGASMFSLFQIMTLESWSMGIVRPVMQLYPYAWVFFVPFILVTSFAVLNLFIGVIVDAMQSHAHEEHAQDEAQAHDEREAILHEVEAMRSQMAGMNEEMGRLRQLLETKGG